MEVRGAQGWRGDRLAVRTEYAEPCGSSDATSRAMMMKACFKLGCGLKTALGEVLRHLNTHASEVLPEQD